MNNEKYEISIVCCYYNEINILKKKFEKFISDRKKFNFSNEIIIADNNSSDGTVDFLSGVVNQNIENLKVIFNSKVRDFFSILAHSNAIKNWFLINLFPLFGGTSLTRL